MIPALPLAAIALLLAVPAFAAPPALPKEVAVGIALSAPQLSASEWKLGVDVSLVGGRIIVASDKNNPWFKFLPSLAGDVVVQARLLNVSANHTVRLNVNDRVTLAFNRQHQKVTVGLLEKGQVATPLAEIPYVKGMLPADRPDDFMITVALRRDQLAAWLDGRQIARTAVPGLAAPYAIGFASGWSSQWTLASFNAFTLR